MIRVHYVTSKHPNSKEIYNLKDLDSLRGKQFQGIEIPPYITSKEKIEETIKILEIIKHQMAIS